MGVKMSETNYKIQITADSTIDLSQDLYQKYNIKVIPFVVTLGDKTFYDGVDITPKDIFEHVNKTKELPKTGARSPEDLKDFFKPFLDKGYDIIHVGIGSKLSSGYEYAKVLEGQNPKVHVVDTTTLSSGSGLIAMYASELAQSGKYSAEQIVEKINKRTPYTQSSFVVEKLNYLYKGGRCSMLALLGANLLRIKPCLQLKDGKIVVTKKYMGNMETALKKYVTDELTTYNNPDHTRIMLTYTTASEGMLKVVREELQKYGKFKEILETKAGSVITSHCGENTLGILYLNDGDEGHY